MNERIIELAIKAREYAESKPAIYQVAYDKKFAELIVKQCARVAQNTDLEDVEGGDRAVLQAAGKHIKQHFGVE